MGTTFSETSILLCQMFSYTNYPGYNTNTEERNYSVGSKCHFGPAVLLADAEGLSGVVAL